MSTLTDTRTEVETEAPAIPDAILANARELNDLRDAAKAIDEREKVLRAAVLDFLTAEGIDAATEGGVTISKSSYDRTGVDTKRLEALYANVYADVKTSTPVTQIRVKIKG